VRRVPQNMFMQDDHSSFDRSDPDVPMNFLDDEQGNVNIPSTGLSVSDEIESSQTDRFVSDVVPVKGLPGVAQVVTMPTASESFEPVRYIVAISPPRSSSPTEPGRIGEVNELVGTSTDFVMIDIPPFDPLLVEKINEFIGVNGRLRLILATNRDAIHYDEAPSVYSTRRADLDKWRKAFSGLEIVAYRLDIPRDCRYAVVHVLDGYGPFALAKSDNDFVFMEMGRPLKVVEWDHTVSEDVLLGKPPPDDTKSVDYDSADMYTPQAIREREEGRRVLAVYTPGYTFGSVAYIFPVVGVCCSGFTIPVEDARNEENLGAGLTGPALDCRGYIATSKARKRQMESAKELVNTYIDRFHVVLPSRGDPLFLDGDVDVRKKLLLETIDQYEKIGDIYEQLGVIADE
jgi:hypothetical protein